MTYGREEGNLRRKKEYHVLLILKREREDSPKMKLLSLMIAFVLCVGCMIPAMAEEQAAFGSEVADIACSTCAVSMSVDAQTQIISMEFIMVPVGTVLE